MQFSSALNKISKQFLLYLYKLLNYLWTLRLAELSYSLQDHIEQYSLNDNAILAKHR